MPLRHIPRPGLRSPRLSPKLALDLARQLDPGRLMTSAGLDPPESWQQEVLLSRHRRIALLCSRQIGKSTTCAVIALHQAMYRDNISVLLVSPSQSQSDLLFEKVKAIFNGLEDKPVDGRAIQGRLELENRSRIISLPGNEATIRGHTAHLLIVDEAAMVSEKLFAAVRPMVAATSGQIIALSTPQGKRGFFYDACNSAAWQCIRVTAEQSTRLSPEDLEMERMSMDSLAFNREFLCEFVDETEQLFSTELIEAMFDPAVEPLIERAPMEHRFDDKLGIPVFR
jgi:hypothetical protein